MSKINKKEQMPDEVKEARLEADVLNEIYDMKPETRGEFLKNLNVENVDELADIMQESRTQVLEKLLSYRIKKLAPEEFSREELAMMLDIDNVEGLGLDLRPNQDSAIRNLIEFLRKKEDKSGYFIQPTGAGKTFIFGLIAKMTEAKTLILVPNLNLIEQTQKSLIDDLNFDANEIGVIEGNGWSVPKDKRVVIGTYQSHVSRMKLDKWKKHLDYRDLVAKSPILICDEAHRAMGQKTQEAIGGLDVQVEDIEDAITEEEIACQKEALENLRSIISSKALTLGFTATPDLANKNVGQYFGEMIGRVTHESMKEAGFLVPYKIHQVEGGVEPGQITNKTTSREEGEFLRNQDIYESLVNKWIETRDGMRTSDNPTPLRTAVFCADINECDEFVSIAESQGLRCRIVTTREKGGSRERGKELVQKAQSDLLEGKIDLIVTVDMLTEGWDCRPINGIVLARATRSAAKIIQAAGRGARTQKKHETEQFGEKKECHIFEGLFRLRSRKEKGINIGPTMQRERGRVPKSISGEGEPFTLGDALATAGNNVQKITQGESGEKIDCIEIHQLDEETAIGELEVDGKKRDVVYLEHYLQNFPNIDEEKLKKHNPDFKSVLLNGTRVNCGQIQVKKVHLKDQVDSIIRAIYNKEIHFNEDGIGMAVDADDIDQISGTGELQGAEVVDLEIYLKSIWKEEYGELNLKAFQNHMFTSHIKPFPIKKEKLYNVEGNTFLRSIYEKSQIDDVLSARALGKLVVGEGDGAGNAIEVIPGRTGAIDYCTLVLGGEELSLRLGGSKDEFMKVMDRIERKISDLNAEDLPELNDILEEYDDELWNYDGVKKWNERFIETTISRKVEEVIKKIKEIMKRKEAA